MSFPNFENKSNPNFGYTDYSIFGLMLCGSLAIGLYFSWRKKKEHQEVDEENAALDYLLGNRKLTLLPVGISLLASLFNGASLVGVTTDIYLYGYHMMFNLLGFIPAGLATHYFFLPVLHDMKLVSIYEYLDQRFDRSLRWLCSMLFFVNAILKIPVQIFLAAVTFNQMTGLDIEMIAWISCTICIIYTCVGGMKAVVWTDVLQFIILFCTLIILLIKGLILIGGFDNLFDRLIATTRIEEPIFDLDPTLRISFWSSTFGLTFHFMTMMIVDQSMVQRYVSLPKLGQAKKALWINVIGNIFTMFLAKCISLLVYAYYHGCDPLSTGEVKHKDQLLSSFAMQALGQYPFLGGIFIAGVFSAALSSISSWLNSTAAIVLEDFVKPLYSRKLSEKMTSIILKGSVLIFGLLSTALVSLVGKLSHAIVLIISLHAITFGPVLGAFTVGLFMPWIGGKPTFCAVVSGFILTGWVVFQTQYDLMQKNLTYQTKPVYVDQCPGGFNGTAMSQGVDSEREFYHITSFYHCLFGCLVTVVIANLFCLIFGRLKNGQLNLNLLAPQIRKFVAEQEFTIVPMKEIHPSAKPKNIIEPSS